MIIYYNLNPIENASTGTISDEQKLKPFTITDHLPNEHIIQSIASGNSTPTIRLLFNSGRVWQSRSSSDQEDQESLLDGSFKNEFGAKRFVTFIDCFTYDCIYLVRDLMRGKTVLYGEGSNHYGCLGNSDGHGVRMIFDPDPSQEITHVTCCFSFSCCVINRRDIRICGQDWIGANTQLYWQNSQFITEEDIVDIKGGNFHLVAYLKDHRFLVAGSSTSGQTLCESPPPSFTYVTLDFPIRSLSCASSKTLIECQNGTFKMYGQSSLDIELSVPYLGSKDVENVRLFRETLVMVPKNHPNILIFQISGKNAQFNIHDSFSFQNYKTIGMVAHSKCLVLYPKSSQLDKFFINLQKSICSHTQFSDISFM